MPNRKHMWKIEAEINFFIFLYQPSVHVSGLWFALTFEKWITVAFYAVWSVHLHHLWVQPKIGIYTMYMMKGERMVPDFLSALPGTVIAFGLKWVPWSIIRRSDLAEHRGETLGPWSWWLQKMRNSWTMMAADDDYWKPMMGLLHKCQNTTHKS